MAHSTSYFSFGGDERENQNASPRLLGTAAAIAVANGANAADLAVSEPVDYVKVCDAYGAGYWYIPGSDTCLKIGGYIRSTLQYYSQTKNRDFAGYAVSGGAIVSRTEHPANWDWKTRTSLQITTQSMTDIGLITGFIDYRAETDNSVPKGGNNAFGGSALTYLDSAYVKAGPLKFGAYTNMYYYSGSFGDIDNGGDNNDAADTTTDQLAFSTSLGGGIGFAVGIADNRDGPGGSGKYDGSWPDFIAALTGASGGFDWKWSVAATDAVVGTGWGTQLAGTYTFANKDAVRAKFAVGNGPGLYYVNNTAPVSGGTWWSAFAAGVHYWSPTVNTSVAAEYANVDTGGLGMWDATVETDWLVAKNFLTGIALGYSDSETGSSIWQLAVRGKRSF